jgi:SARP family transcriptional regulator, regulator of embCAB operon
MGTNVALEVRPLADVSRATTSRTRAVLSARFLGSFQATLDHRAVPLGTSRRTRVLLAYLIDRGTVPVPRDVLMDVFWPDSTPAAARNSLHVAMCAVRKALATAWPGPVIERRGDVYQFSEQVDLWSDVGEVARRCDLASAAAAAGRLQEAVDEYEAARALYGGEYLADDPYLEWALERREDARLRALGCAERLSELHLELGNVREAVALCTHVLREEPCHEPVARRLMIAYARLGQPHMALRQYDRIVHELHRDLGVAAAVQTVALADAIRRRDAV